jgi:hypothetical protein
MRVLTNAGAALGGAVAGLDVMDNAVSIARIVANFIVEGIFLNGMSTLMFSV